MRAANNFVEKGKQKFPKCLELYLEKSCVNLDKGRKKKLVTISEQILRQFGKLNFF